MYQPILRADFTLFDQYEFSHEASAAVQQWGELIHYQHVAKH